MTKPCSLPALLVTALLSASSLAAAAPACPAAVTSAATKAYPDATIRSCVAENASFEVKLARKDRTVVELDISAKGEIEQVEERIAVAALPAAVTQAFAGKYPKLTILSAEQQTKADHSVTYELAFKAGKARHEATFKSDGTFVEQE